MLPFSQNQWNSKFQSQFNHLALGDLNDEYNSFNDSRARLIFSLGHHLAVSMCSARIVRRQQYGQRGQDVRSVRFEFRFLLL